MIDWKTISLEHLAGFISSRLREKGIDAILVGGACVTIYSHNRYQSYDLDFIVYEDMKMVTNALTELGFQKKGKHFCHKNCDWMIEFVTPPVAVGNEIISKFNNVHVATGTIKMLRIEDSIKDRLASYFHWNDRQGLDQALEICKINHVDLKEIKHWAMQEGFTEKFEEFIQRLQT